MKLQYSALLLWTVTTFFLAKAPREDRPAAQHHTERLYLSHLVFDRLCISLALSLNVSFHPSAGWAIDL